MEIEKIKVDKDMSFRQIIKLLMRSTEAKKDYADQQTVNLLFQALTDKLTFDQDDLSAQASCRLFHLTKKLDESQIKQRESDFTKGGMYIAKRLDLI